MEKLWRNEKLECVEKLSHSIDLIHPNSHFEPLKEVLRPLSDLICTYLNDSDPLVLDASTRYFEGCYSSRGYWHIDPASAEPRTGEVLSIGIPLSKFSERQGATICLPGSHNFAPPERAEEDWTVDANLRIPITGEVSLEADVGDCFLFDGRTWHARGARNGGDEVRKAIFVQVVSTDLEHRRRLSSSLRLSDCIAEPLRLDDSPF